MNKPIYRNSADVLFYIFAIWKSTVKLNKPIGRKTHMYSTKAYLCWVLAFFTCITGIQAQEVRTIEGTENNLENIHWGAFETELKRDTENSYLDGSSIIDDVNKPNARIVSNIIFDQPIIINDSYNHSSYVWAFGQFLDHDISLVENNSTEQLAIEVPNDDQVFIPGSSIFLPRSKAVEGTGVGENNPRQYKNEVTSFVDASVIYGSTSERAAWLRTNAGDGKLKTSEGDLLPWNTISGEYNSEFDPNTPIMEDAFGSGNKLFVAGDVRANENPLLISLHTIFLREHNRLCDAFAQENPSWSGEKLYQESRRMIGAYIQSITYEEWLPSININLPAYSGYRSNVDATINNVFSAAAFRMGHTLINGEIIRMDNEGDIIDRGNLALRDGFFQPLEVQFAGGIEPYAKGMATQVQQEMDAKVIDDVRNFLFSEEGGFGLDLAAINIVRGRERGLIDYNSLRSEYGLTSLNNFNDLTDDPNQAILLENLYGDINNLDAWVGMLAEKHIPGSMFGELVSIIIRNQFQNLRDGDRFYYENDPALSESRKASIKATRLHDIIMRNCEIDAMQYNVFTAMPHGDIPSGPDLTPTHLEAALFPNPITSGTQLKLYGERDEPVTVRVFDIHGRQLYSLTESISEGENFLNMPFESNDWRKGFYTLVITTEDRIKTLKFTIQ